MVVLLIFRKQIKLREIYQGAAIGALVRNRGRAGRDQRGYYRSARTAPAFFDGLWLDRVRSNGCLGRNGGGPYQAQSVNWLTMRSVKNSLRKDQHDEQYATRTAKTT